MSKNVFITLLKRKWCPPLAVREPIAVALAAATAARALGYQAEKSGCGRERKSSQNGMGVIVPGCGEMGLHIAAAAAL